MYRCQICGAVAPEKTPAVRVVLETREKSYPPRSMKYLKKTHKGRLLTRQQRRHPKTEYFADVPTGAGWEVAREVLACPACAARR